jgi:hypothetical protein
MDAKITGWIDLLVTKMVEWVDNLFSFFGLYTSKYSKWIVILVGLWIVSSFVNLKGIFGGGRR